MVKSLSFQHNTKVQKHRWIILVAVGLFTFMSTLDGSIVNIALPIISKDLNVPMNQTIWIVSIYLMVVCACLPLFGKISDSWGKINVFKIGTIVFVVGSFLCGFRGSLLFLLFARIIQALGASMTMAANTGIITEIFPLHERGRALGMLGAFVSLGSIAGPGVGGLIVSRFSWSYIFWINVPVGLLTICLGALVLPKDILKSGDKIDFKGFTAFSLGVLTLFGGVFVGQEIGFAHWLVIGLWGIAAIALIIFYKIEQRTAVPLIKFTIFKNKMFTLSLVTALLIFSSNFFINVVMPFFLENARGYSASQAGLLLMVFPMVMVVAAPVSGYMADKIGAEILTMIGLIILTISQFAYLFLGINTPIPILIMMTGAMGLGNALFQSPNNTIVMSSVDKEYLGIAGSLNSLARNFGMVIGISLSTTILYRAMSINLGKSVNTYIPDRPDVFIFGMHAAFLGSFLICLTAFLLTAYRSIKRRRTIKTK